MYAVIQTGGKQYRVQKGDCIRVERLAAGAGDKVAFPVLLIGEGADIKVGQPTVASAEVTATVQGHERGEKLIVFKYRRRKGYRRKNGHRQEYTAVRIEDISVKS
ncbi:MAG TPA: 50S ribosomal protein L21 [Pseudomonadota bacterium]|jgi:large subunit ribosomal protein L21|nr:50S ribosomal protein L21 [Pseudomonadota bacterium]